MQVAADAHHDHRGCEHVFHVLGETRDIPAPRAHGRACEGVGAAGVGQCRRHLGDAEAETGEKVVTSKNAKQLKNKKVKELK